MGIDVIFRGEYSGDTALSPATGTLAILNRVQQGDTPCCRNMQRQGQAGGATANAGPGDLAYTDGPVPTATITAAEDTLLVLLAGDPYGEDLLMFWNFVGESENAVRTAREEWEDEHARARRYGVVEGYPGFEGEPTRAQIDRIPAPPMPAVKLRARRNR